MVDDIAEFSTIITKTVARLKIKKLDNKDLNEASKVQYLQNEIILSSRSKESKVWDVLITPYHDSLVM